MKIESEQQKSMLAVNMGLVANTLLAILKTSVGILGHSPALLADGINSTSDVAYYIVVSIFIRLARNPPDHEHPYGHRQLESIAAVVVGSFVITTAIAIFWKAINDVYDLLRGGDDFTGAAIGALWVALLTVALKIGLTVVTRRLGEQTKNVAVLALASDHRNDVLSASAATVGIFLGRMGVLWVDPLTGALVALLILWTGVEILRKSSANLMGTLPGQRLAQQITNLVSAVRGVKQVEEIRAYRFGPYLVVNLTIGVDGTLSVTAGDAIASKVEDRLYQRIALLRQVYVHYHPAWLGVNDSNRRFQADVCHEVVPETIANNGAKNG